MSLRLEGIRHPDLTWIRNQLLLITHAAIEWVQVPAVLMGIYQVFYEYVVLPMSLTFFPTKPLLPESVHVLTGGSLLNPQRSESGMPGKPIGLNNENGNDCFINAIRQLLFNIPTLRRLVIDKLPIKRYPNTHASATMYSSAQQGDLPLSALGGSRAARDDVGMQTGLQEDAFEALGKFFDGINDVKSIDQYAPFSPNNVEDHNPLFFWIRKRLRYEVKEVYENLSKKSKDRIGQDGWLHPKPESNFAVNLDLKGMTNISLEAALSRWADSDAGGGTYDVSKDDGETVKLELLQEENRFKELPPYLFLSFKRFERKSGRNSKVNRIVDMDETFVLDKSIVQTRKNGRYRIQGFVSHIGGSTYFGHYISFLFVPKVPGGNEGHWYRCDDRMVSQVDISVVRKELSTCYIVYSELEEEISDDQARAILTSRKKQTTARELQLATEVSLKLAESNTLKNRIEKMQGELDILNFFKTGVSTKDANATVLKEFFNNTPKDFQGLCHKLLELEKGYSSTQALNYLHELRTITAPYLVHNQKNPLIWNIIDQYIYMKEQNLLLLKNPNPKQHILLQIKQLLALQAVLRKEASTKEHIELVWDHLPQEVQKELANLKAKFEKATFLQKVGELLKTSTQIYTSI